MKSYLEQSERRLQALESRILVDTPKEPEKDAKEQEADEFIRQMKEINKKPGKDIPGKGVSSGNSSIGDDENEFIRLMQEINK